MSDNLEWTKDENGISVAWLPFGVKDSKGREMGALLRYGKDAHTQWWYKASGGRDGKKHGAGPQHRMEADPHAARAAVTAWGQQLRERAVVKAAKSCAHEWGWVVGVPDWNGAREQCRHCDLPRSAS